MSFLGLDPQQVDETAVRLLQLLTEFTDKLQAVETIAGQVDSADLAEGLGAVQNAVSAALEELAKYLESKADQMREADTGWIDDSGLLEELRKTWRERIEDALKKPTDCGWGTPPLEEIDDGDLMERLREILTRANDGFPPEVISEMPIDPDFPFDPDIFVELEPVDPDIFFDPGGPIMTDCFPTPDDIDDPPILIERFPWPDDMPFPWPDDTPLPWPDDTPWPGPDNRPFPWPDPLPDPPIDLPRPFPWPDERPWPVPDNKPFPWPDPPIDLPRPFPWPDERPWPDPPVNRPTPPWEPPEPPIYIPEGPPLETIWPADVDMGED